MSTALRRFQTLPNLQVPHYHRSHPYYNFSAPNHPHGQRKHNITLSRAPSHVQEPNTNNSWKYAATEVTKSGNMSEDEEELEDGEEGDSEMLTSGSPSAGDSDSASTAETESVCERVDNSNASGNSSDRVIRRDVNIVGKGDVDQDDVSSLSWKEDCGGLGDVDQEAVNVTITPDQLSSEWETTGGKADVLAAFEGKMVLDAPLKSVLEWAAPIVWKMFLRQAPLCSAAIKNPSHHTIQLAQNTPCPSFLPALLEKSMPKYSGMTASIAVTYALLYMYRIKFCFHCNGSSLCDAKSVNTNQSPSPATSTTSSGDKPIPPDSMEAMRQKSAKSFEKPSMLEPGLQCTLLFAVSMHLTSMWILDSCPGDRHYWKRYVRCIPTDRGVNWTRLVLFSGWRYSINVSLEDWLTFTATILQSYPFLHDSQREAAVAPTTSTSTI